MGKGEVMDTSCQTLTRSAERQITFYFFIQNLTATIFIQSRELQGKIIREITSYIYQDRTIYTSNNLHQKLQQKCCVQQRARYLQILEIQLEHLSIILIRNYNLFY